MWSNKKQDKPPPADPGLKNVQMNQSLKTAQASAYFKGSIEIEKSGEEERDKNAFSQTAPAPTKPAADAGPRSI